MDRPVTPDADVVAITINDGGGTFEAGTGLRFAPDQGYAVALCRGTYAFATRADDLATLGHRVAQEFGASYFGTWIDDKDVIHVDPVAYIVDRGRAIALAIDNEQLAIYSFGDRTVIDTSARR
jgi:hypothetical protein